MCHDGVTSDGGKCAARLQGIHVTAYSPLGSPDSATMLRRENAPELLKDAIVKEVADKIGKHPAQVSTLATPSFALSSYSHCGAAYSSHSAALLWTTTFNEEERVIVYKYYEYAEYDMYANCHHVSQLVCFWVIDPPPQPPPL